LSYNLTCSVAFQPHFFAPWFRASTRPQKKEAYRLGRSVALAPIRSVTVLALPTIFAKKRPLSGAFFVKYCLTAKQQPRQPAPLAFALHFSPAGICTIHKNKHVAC